MGILDAPARRLVSPRIAAWHRVLTEATADSSILVLGDSTGAGATRWPRLLASKIAAAYPAWTVIYKPFDDPSKTYPAGSFETIQTGTNGKTLHFYNGSVSGQVVGYAMNTSQVYAITPSSPDLILFNYGHNSPQLTDDYRGVAAQVMNGYLAKYPNAAVVVCTQNPRAVTDPEYAADQGKQRANYEYAVGAGLPVIDANAAFLAYGNYAADLLLPDGLHPSDAGGSPFWANLAWDVLRPSKFTTPPGQQAVPSRLWIPATQLWSVTGSPVQSVKYGLQTWALSDSADTAIATVVDFPAGWKRTNIFVVWTTDAASPSGSAVFTGAHNYLGTAGWAMSSGASVGVWTEGSGAGTFPTPQTAKTRLDAVWARTSLSQSPCQLKIQRTGTAGADTMVGDAIIFGLMIERAY